MNFTDGGLPIADDPPDYPPAWTADQRLTAYWYIVNHHVTVESTSAWQGVLISAEREADRKKTKIAELLPTNVIRLRPRYDR
jgi:hypothetical protein